MPSTDAAGLSAAILSHAGQLQPGKSLAPQDVAMALAGKDEKEWSRLMKPLRAAALSLAAEGRVVLLRKGKPVSGEGLKGLYRIALPQGAQPQGDGNG
ncbi:MAG: DUF3253 domain-containing protein [Notoacmeibacter sp.]|nr:DUF3253 domain-containing protein [Notoacmeibacter sp.]